MAKRGLKDEYKDMVLELTNQYTFICLVDARENTFEVIRMASEYTPLVNCFKKLMPLMFAFAQAHVDIAFREQFRTFADVQRVYKAFLDGKKEEEGTFVNTRGEWVKVRVMPVPDFSEQNPKGIIAFENCTQSMRRQLNPEAKLLETIDSYAWIGMIDSQKQYYKTMTAGDDESWFPEEGTTKSLRAFFMGRMARENVGDFERVYELADCPEKGYIEEEFVFLDEEGKSHYYSVYCTKVMEETEFQYMIFARNMDETKAKKIIAKKEKEELMIQLIEEQNEALRVALETAEAASKAKSIFLSNMSHDIRTPMNAITGMTSIAKQNIENPEKVMDCLDKISIASNHLLSLINNILDMSKIENGITTLNEDRFRFSDMIEDINDIVQPQLKAKKLELTVSTKGIIHDRLIGDTLRLRQVFINIIGNSIKFTPEGGKLAIRIRELKETHAGYATFHCTFSDNGIGMTPEFIEKIFEPFEREKNMTLSKAEGTGLGMAITKNIIEMMNGHIKVKSEVGKGTTFRILIHLKMQEDSDVYMNLQESENNSTEVSSICYSDKRVLLVEDNELNMEIAEDMLGMTGVMIEKAWDGSQAVEMVKNSKEGYYDMILCDIQMPNMNGYETTSVLRTLNRMDTKNMPIVAMTANAFAEDRQKALDVGMNYHIAKPIAIDVLFEVLQRFLSGDDEKSV